MILYKYVTHEVALAILKNSSIGFSQPMHFNDPFELEASYPTPLHGERTEIVTNFRILTKKRILKKYYGVLSLTRDPLNPLMWAHYANNHTGVVIGFDVKIDELTSLQKNIIPIQYGNVIYTSKKPTSEYISQPSVRRVLGETVQFNEKDIEKQQRTFLYKPSCWAYEEEVRVVKNIKTLVDDDLLGFGETAEIESGTFTKIEANNRSVYCLNLPKGAIKEVYFGVRNIIYPRGNLTLHAENTLLIIEALDMHSDLGMYICEIDNISWGLKHQKLAFSALRDLIREHYANQCQLSVTTPLRNQ